MHKGLIITIIVFLLMLFLSLFAYDRLKTATDRDLKELFFEIRGKLWSTLSEEEAHEVLDYFYTDHAPEPLTERYLLRAGKAIVPYLLFEIKKKGMPKRLYAIGALGEIGDRRALPVLIEILEDRSEMMNFRTDVLEAIWRIDRKIAEEYAAKYVGESKDIERVLALLRDGKI